MARILILGGGFGGVATAVTLSDLLGDEHEIILVSQRPYFMVGFRKTWAMLEIAPLSEGQRPLSALARRGIKVIEGTVEGIYPAGRAAIVDGRWMVANVLVVALGVRHALEKVPGFAEYALNAYALQGLDQVTAALRSFKGGRIVTGVFGLPYQCPPAPYEVAIMTKEYFQQRNVDVEMTVITPQATALPVAGPEASRQIEQRLADCDIRFLPNMAVTAVAPGAVLCDDVRLDCDLALGVPPHIAVDVVRNSPLAGADGWVAADRLTLETGFEGVYAIGDCVKIAIGDGGRVPMAGLFAEKEGVVVARRIAARLRGQEPEAIMDGHAACYMEAGQEEGAVIGGDFYADPKPDVAISAFGAAQLAEKKAFEQTRLAEWFG